MGVALMIVAQVSLDMVIVLVSFRSAEYCAVAVYRNA